MQGIVFAYLLVTSIVEVVLSQLTPKFRLAPSSRSLKKLLPPMLYAVRLALTPSISMLYALAAAEENLSEPVTSSPPTRSRKGQSYFARQRSVASMLSSYVPPGMARAVAPSLPQLRLPNGEAFALSLSLSVLLAEHLHDLADVLLRFRIGHDQGQTVSRAVAARGERLRGGAHRGNGFACGAFRTGHGGRGRGCGIPTDGHGSRSGRGRKARRRGKRRTGGLCTLKLCPELPQGRPGHGGVLRF